jgi:asparagine synthase (glutamine-hydrolysing)
VTRQLRSRGPGYSGILATFREAVPQRLPDEGEAGVALSGGLDSTAVAAVAARACKTPLPTSSLRMPGNPYDESEASRYVAQELELPNREVVMTGALACELLPRAIWHLESPFWFGAIATPFLELSRVARSDGFKVALTGDGADELLAGYDFYRVMRLNALLAFWRIAALQPILLRSAVKWLGVPVGLDRAHQIRERPIPGVCS